MTGTTRTGDRTLADKAGAYGSVYIGVFAVAYRRHTDDVAPACIYAPTCYIEPDSFLLGKDGTFPVLIPYRSDMGEASV